MTHPDTIIVIGVKTLMLFPLAAQKSVPFHLSFFLFLLERKKEREKMSTRWLIELTGGLLSWELRKQKLPLYLSKSHEHNLSSGIYFKLWGFTLFLSRVNMSQHVHIRRVLKDAYPPPPPFKTGEIRFDTGNISRMRLWRERVAE